MKRNTALFLVKETFREWQNDNALRLGAALSYYTIFSLAPLLLIIIAVAGLAFGQGFAREHMMNQMTELLGANASNAIGEMLQHAGEPKKGLLATFIGLLTLLFGATGVVTQLQDALNTIWEVKPKSESGIIGFMKGRFVSLALILGVGFLLLVSLVISAAVTAIAESIGTEAILQILQFLLSVAVVTVLFAMMFKYLPDTDVKWRNVWIGAFVTAILFTVGKTLTGIYLARSSVASGYGAAGSLVIILLWVYYNSQILFFGAEFTQVYSSMKRDQTPASGESEEGSRRTESEKEVPEMDQEDIQDQQRSPLYKMAYRTGYQLQKMENSNASLKKKMKWTKWGYRIVQFLGLKTSAKLGWKGFKLKRKLDKHKEEKGEAA